jgi:hypothetical protein
MSRRSNQNYASAACGSARATNARWSMDQPGLFRKIPPWLVFLLVGVLGLGLVAGALKWRAASLSHSRAGTASGGHGSK